MLYFCRVGLSAGTGLGVSSALVQNTGNETTNQDAANNNPPPNQGPANNQAPVNQVANNADEDENYVEGENDLIGQDADNGHAAPVYGPVNQQHAPNPNVGDEMEVDAIENDALNDDPEKPCTVQKSVKCSQKEQNNKNLGNSSEEETDNIPKSCCSCDCHKTVKSSNRNNPSSFSKSSGNKNSDAQPGTSGSTPTSAMQLRPRSSTGIVTPKNEDNRKKDKDTGELEHDSNTSVSTKSCSQTKRRRSNQADQKAHESSEVKDNSTTDVNGKTSSTEQLTEPAKERSETPDGRTSVEKEAYASSLGLETKLRRSARLSRGHTGGDEVPAAKTTVSPNPGSVTPIASNMSSSDPENTSPEPGQRKGKSWYVGTDFEFM